MNEKFLDFYYTLTGENETDILKIKNKDILAHIIDLILMEKGVNNRVLKITKKLNWINPKSKIIGHIVGYYGDGYDKGISFNDFFPENAKKYDKDKEIAKRSIFYNKKKISESEVKELVSKYWINIRLPFPDGKINELLGTKLGYFTPIQNVIEEKKFYLNIIYGIEGSKFEFKKDNYHEIVYLYDNNKEILERIYKMIKDSDNVLQKLKPKFYVKRVELQSSKSYFNY
jgi:hypothetical protein